jgi:hypothetical protein
MIQRAFRKEGFFVSILLKKLLVACQNSLRLNFATEPLKHRILIHAFTPQHLFSNSYTSLSQNNLYGGFNTHPAHQRYYQPACYLHPQRVAVHAK